MSSVLIFLMIIDVVLIVININLIANSDYKTVRVLGCIGILFAIISLVCAIEGLIGV